MTLHKYIAPETFLNPSVLQFLILRVKKDSLAPKGVEQRFKMATIYEGDIQKSIEKISEALKPLIEIPKWTIFVKTSSSKARLPANADWYLIRAASILITIYKKGPIGVSKLRTKYGSKKDRGHKPEKFTRASGKIIRTILQQLDKSGLTQYKKEGIHKGRIITAKGKSIVDKNAVIKKDGK